MHPATIPASERATMRDGIENHVRSTESEGRPSTAAAPATRPGLICLAAGEQDRSELAALLAGIAERGIAGTDTIGMDGLLAATAARRAVLAGPDAVTAIIQGRTASLSSTVDLAFAPPPAPSGTPAVADSGVATAGAGTGAASHRTPTGPFDDRATAHDRTVLSGLTPRESEVARLVGAGMNVGEIAQSLGREKTTVISHRRSLLRKIGCRDALGIARFAYRTGLATP